MSDTPDNRKLAKELENAVLSLDMEQIKQCREKFASISDPWEVIDKVIVPVLDEVGEGWEQGELSLSQVYISCKTCESIVDEILSSQDGNTKETPKIAIAILNDQHKLGKKLVGMCLKSAGYQFVDFDTQTDEKIIERAINEEIKVLLISALMLPSALKIKEVTSAFKSTNKDIVVIVGGAPFRFDKELYKEVGADHMCNSAAEVIPLLEKIFGE